MRTIRISDAVWAAIAERGKFGETEDDVLRRVFDLPSARQGQQVGRTGRRGRGSVRYATKRVSPYIKDDLFFVPIEGVPVENWELPARTDITGIKRIRSAAMAFGRKHGLTDGQIAAITKTLTSAGYYVHGPRNSGSRRYISPTDLDV